MYNASIIELYLVQISGLLSTLSLLHTYCSSSYIKNEAARVTAARLVYKAALLHSRTIPICVSDKQLVGPNQNKTEREGEYLLPMPSLLIRNENLNTGYCIKKNICIQLVYIF
jgi:hypothetical protein